eukprot:CAMPEP_0185608444 /NCGR_PEP_ID=MMETSP0436-20130131/7153_1 /TAXON_ID=626734 ORGANISM="Favella taraikaensis, Strain Fe Narragansett Bay" /NCGR_SAMPLE_ID=MMETSP0436 /ASSEMBLY_ACC=CAM_ASM_000390 /LENGTH=85 /DNA_ID=CAMNT_0028240643 /DNA_START=51 /DNA_END=309 /DNA_ORIENTATION=-
MTTAMTTTVTTAMTSVVPAMASVVPAMVMVITMVVGRAATSAAGATTPAIRVVGVRLIGVGRIVVSVFFLGFGGEAGLVEVTGFE